MTTKTARLSISVPRVIYDATAAIANEMNTTRSKIVAQCLKEMIEKRQKSLLAAGYEAMAQENEQFAKMASKAGSEVINRLH